MRLWKDVGILRNEGLWGNGKKRFYVESKVDSLYLENA